ncbi:hypothetical protein C943_00379 [Mariniradius saccharolyticus AK6]|uniref:Uncharacterized protein n=1 Tax=Mariniradius saccharolyticus AK6 TaxID=1239962 RepID=M7XX68_9BACT|nr:hypothetical protein C943_00379 [Mariniradius saccharolyticus AK6]
MVGKYKAYLLENMVILVPDGFSKHFVRKGTYKISSNSFKCRMV